MQIKTGKKGQILYCIVYKHPPFWWDLRVNRHNIIWISENKQTQKAFPKV